MKLVLRSCNSVIAVRNICNNSNTLLVKAQTLNTDKHCSRCVWCVWCAQVNVFLSRLCGEPIGFTVVGIFVIDKNTILTVRHLKRISSYHHLLANLIRR